MNIERLVMMFVRWPEPGEAKTRLAASVGEDAAVALYRAMVEESVAQLRTGALEYGYTLRLYATPVNQLRNIALWLNDGRPPVLDAMPQPGGALADRLEHAIEAGFSRLKAQRVIVVGSDVPQLTPAIIGAAFAKLDARDAVIGRAHDGGFYLLALKSPQPDLFREVTYSAPATGGELLAALERRGLRIDTASLPVLHDVDVADDLRALPRNVRKRLRERMEARGESWPQGL